MLYLAPSSSTQAVLRTLHIFQSRGALTSKENGLQALKHAIPGWHIHIQEALSAYYTLEYNSPMTSSNLPVLYNAPELGRT